MNHKVTVVVSSLLLLFSQTSVLSQSSFQNTTLANTQIAQQSESDSSSHTDSPKKRRSAGPRFIDLQFPENDNGGEEYFRQWLDSDGKINSQNNSFSLEKLNSIIANNPQDFAAYNNRGNLYAELGKYDLALADYDQAISLNPQQTTPIYINRAIIYQELGKYDLALANYDRALESSQKNGNRAEEATTLNNRGILYIDIKQPQQALDYYNRALHIFQEIGNRQKEQYTLNQIALTYYQLGEKEKSLDYLEQVLAIAEEQNDTVAEGITLNNIGEIYWSLGQKTTAKKYHELALTIFQDSNSELVTKVEQNIASNLSTEKITFSCGSINGTPTTIANTIKDDISFISWNSSDFTVFPLPQQKCEIVTAKLEKGYQNGLKYLTTGYKNGQPVICMTSTNMGGCEEILFALRQDSDPEEQLQALLNIRIGAATSEPLYQSSSSRIYVDLEKYFNTAPPIQKSQPLTKRETTKLKRSQKTVSE